MRTKEELLKIIKEKKVISIFRGLEKKDVKLVFRTLLKWDLCVVEITMTSPGVLDSIRLARKHFGNQLFIGVGTVLSAKEANDAIEAGAEFVISPNTNQKVIEATIKRGVLSIPGAITPTEIYKAHCWGADLVKIFPISSLGSSYFKNILSVYKSIKLVPTGGINAENMSDYFNSGAFAVGIGGDLFRSSEVLENDFLENLDKRSQKNKSRFGRDWKK